jgi:tetratricopeptide (TPR) repeat protein|tara:strand:+ start:4606 stop:5043 length:438 start_codon:yes stop_codon:yes gene_type:complete
MIKKIKILTITFLLFNFMSPLIAEDNFFEKGVIKYGEEKYEESKFLFQRNIVFNPADTKSYLYLAKIFNFEENKKEEEKNIETVLLLDPENEEAIYMLMNIELTKSNYSKVKKLTKTFSKVCKNLCEKKELIIDSLKNLEPKNES